MPVSSTDLMLAILAMDAYNQGPIPGLLGVGGNIGGATRLGIQPSSDAGNSGFSATAYSLNGQTVIAYRGSDVLPGRNGAAIFDSASWQDLGAWSLTFDNNYAAAQAVLAQTFYDQVRNQVPGQQIITTGHSLGGALQGSANLRLCKHPRS
jgi:hypothetical protein